MLTRRTFLGAAAAIPAATLFAQTAAAAEPPVYASNGVAINGYDPVAYFTEGKPVEGSPEHTVDWEGATLQFASAENKAMFEGDPEKFAPKYGGYCAYAASRGYVANIDVNAWRIHKDKLYLNYSIGVGKSWAKQIDANIAKADEIWPKPLEN